MQESMILEVAAPATDYAAQAAAYAAADASFFAATQAAAQQSVAAAGELVKSGGEAAMSAGEMAILAGEAAGAAVMATAAGLALPLILGGIGIAGLAGLGHHAWKANGWTVAGIRAQLSDRLGKEPAPGQWPEWEGHTDEAIWNDDQLLEEATRPEPELGEVDWSALELECAA